VELTAPLAGADNPPNKFAIPKSKEDSSMQFDLPRICNHLAVAALMLMAAASSARAQGTYAVTKTLKVGGAGSWDYVTVDPQEQRLYLTRSTHTMVIDAATGKLIADIPGQKRAHGVALVARVGRGFITDGEDGSVAIFDLKTNHVVGKLAAADDADGIIYDPKSDRVLVSCGDSGLLLAFPPDIDPKSGKAQQVELGGKPEFLAADGSGKAFVNLADKALVAVVDLGSMKVLGRFPVAPAGEPVGLAIDPTGGHLFVGCRSRNLIVMSTSDGHILADLPIGATNDACAFDPGTGDIFASCGDGTLTIARETSLGKFAIVQKLQTRRGAKTMGLDPSTHAVYLPAVEYQEGQQDARGRLAAKPDSFMVLVATPRG
jgi:DNA-binding beta-propeller fold protein YncE